MRQHRRAILRLAATLLLPATLASTASSGTGTGTAYFPLTGTAAVHQRSLDAANPVVVMIVAPEPGAEDLRLLAYLRAHQGIRTAVAFLTNGEATPGDTLSQFPVWMAGERKMEAYRAARTLDADAWFINAPDVAAPEHWTVLARFWDSTGVITRLVEVVRTVQPDIIVVTPDRRAGAAPLSGRDSLMHTVVRTAVREAAGTRDTSASKGLLPWNVARLYARRPASQVPVAFSKRHPVLGTTASAMSETAGAWYRTLRLRMREWVTEGSTYHDITRGSFTARPAPPETIGSDLQEPGPRLSASARAFRTAVRSTGRGIRSVAVRDLRQIIGSLESVIVHEKKVLTRRERRIAMDWKQALEDLRCAARGIDLQIRASDSVLTASQIFFLHVDPDPRSKGRGETIILFPLAASGEWTVNEKAGYFFPLDSASRFNILTPSEVQYTVPVSEFGLSQARMDAVFPFVVVHKDPRPELNYMARRDVRLQFGPRRTFTLRTPLVFDAPTTPVIVELQNISRDKFRGDLVLSDTTGEPSRIPVEFTRKDERIVDTLFLPGEPAMETGGRALLLELSGRGGRRFVTARAFHVSADTNRRVGLLSTIHDTPLEEALRIVRAPPAGVTTGDIEAGTHRAEVLLIDRDYLSDTLSTGALRRGLLAWIHRGGHAVIFPQHEGGEAWLRNAVGATFGRTEPVPPAHPVAAPWNGLEQGPDPIGHQDWEGWVETRGVDRIVSSRPDAKVSMRMAGTGVDLIASYPVGLGSVTLVAADVQSQLMNYHPGAYRLIAHLIAMRP